MIECYKTEERLYSNARMSYLNKIVYIQAPAFAANGENKVITGFTNTFVVRK